MSARCILLISEGTDRAALAELARHRRWTVCGTLLVTGSNVALQLEELREVLQRREVQAVVADSVQFPGLATTRVLRELLTFARRGVEILSVREPWLEIRGGQRLLLEWIVERLEQERSAKIKSALLQVREQGRRLGRPRAEVPVARVLEMRAEGASLRQIARATGLGVATAQRFLVARGRGSR